MKIYAPFRSLRHCPSDLMLAAVSKAARAMQISVVKRGHLLLPFAESENALNTEAAAMI